jgi:hypothetical protein
MKKSVRILSYAFVGISCLSLLYVAIMAWFNPRAVMALVSVTLDNNDALSSIRGVYGGVGFALVGLIIAIARKELRSSLLFLSVFWFLYALSRIVTLMMDGPLGDFGHNWLTIETVFGLLAAILFLATKPSAVVSSTRL